METMNTHKWLWRMCALWPLPNDPIWYKVYTILVHSNFLYFNVSILMSLIYVANIHETIEVLLLSTTYILAIMKAVVLVVNQKKVSVTIDLMKLLESSTQESLEEREMLKLAAKRSKSVLYIIGFFCYFGISVIFLTNLMNGILMYPAVYPFEWKHNLLLYYTAMAYQVLSSIFVLLAVTTLDIYGPAMYNYLEAYIDILKWRLERIGIVRPSGTIGSVGINSFSEFGECIKYHTQCLELCRLLNDLFEIHFGIEFGTTSVTICVSAFKLSLVGCVLP